MEKLTVSFDRRENYHAGFQKGTWRRIPRPSLREAAWLSSPARAQSVPGPRLSCFHCPGLCWIARLPGFVPSSGPETLSLPSHWEHTLSTNPSPRFHAWASGDERVARLDEREPEGSARPAWSRCLPIVLSLTVQRSVCV